MWSPVLHSCSSTELMAAMPAARSSQASVGDQQRTPRSDWHTVVFGQAWDAAACAPELQV